MEGRGCNDVLAAGEEQDDKDHGKQQSDSAILINKINKQTTIFQVKELINDTINNEQQVPPIFCRTSMNNKLLILQSDTDENTMQLLHIIEKYPQITEIAELTYKLYNQQKIIITGIPTSTSTSNIITYLTENTSDQNITIEKILQKEKSTNYHIILNIEAKAAKELIAKKYLLVGLYRCHIRKYRPIIRCGKCQLYGHTESNCRRNPICAMCARGHWTSACPYMDDRSQHRCTNCFQLSNYSKHTANSNLCPLYQSFLADRRRIT